jgi:methionine transaminase
MNNKQATINSKLPNFGTTIFTLMSKMASDYGAINLSQGFPDFNCSEELIELVNEFMKKGLNRYAQMPGVPILREVISSKIEKLYGRKYSPGNEIIITAGATQAIYTAVTASINNGDEVIILEPAYDSYAPSVIFNGGIPVFIPPNKNDFSIDWDSVKDSITRKTKMIMINSPHNPTGNILTGDDIKSLEEITRGTNILILSDEVYEHIIFDGEEHLSISSSEELSERAFVISSFGKTFHTTGWKVGYCSAPQNLIKEFKKVHQFLVFSVNTPIQYAYAEFLKDEGRYLSLNNFYQSRRDLVLQILGGSRFRFKPAKGTYFQLLDYSEISNENDMKFSEYLTKEIGVAVIPLSPFYSKGSNEKYIRICFAKRDEVLIEAVKKLANM